MEVTYELDIRRTRSLRTRRISGKLDPLTVLSGTAQPALVQLSADPLTSGAYVLRVDKTRGLVLTKSCNAARRTLSFGEPSGVRKDSQFVAGLFQTGSPLIGRRANG